ncbi:hypothetical protein [Streptomyces sp. ICBB 8177]|uniref:hypothetical protein n=1 Tax=Streptomyces sp. ICBB 8177 TaxID=563922 RepID=UPI001F545763|nr:hypothetical protein [Streptomyces sp. ICBB 8177]
MSTSVVRKGRRGMVRATLLGAAVAASVLGPAAGAFAADGAAPSATDPSATAPSTPAAGGTPSAAPSAKSAPSASTPAPAGRATVPVREFTLVDGEQAKVGMVGPHAYRAEIAGKKGQPLAGILETHGKDDAIDLHGMRVVLYASDGDVASWWLSSTTPEPSACTATETIPSDFPPYEVLLSNGPAGPRAALEGSGRTLAVVDRTHPVNLSMGMKIQNVGGVPEFFQRTQGGSTPWGTCVPVAAEEVRDRHDDGYHRLRHGHH